MERKRRKKTIIISVVIVVILILSINVFSSNRNNQDSVAVNAMAIELTDILVRVPANGIIEEVNRHPLFHESISKVISVEVKEGDEVKAGQTLAYLEPDDVSLRLTIKNNQLEIEKLDLEKLENTRERTVLNLERAKNEAREALEKSKALYEVGAISKAELSKSIETLENAELEYNDLTKSRDNLSIDIEKMEKRIEITRIELNELKREQERSGTKIISPADGIVTKVDLEVGATASPSNPSFIISDLSELKIDINVSEFDISKVKVGQVVEITSDAIGDMILYGEVDTIAPVATRVTSGQVNETIVPVTIKLKDAHEGIKPGFSVRTRIISEEKEDVKVVPFDTVVVQQNGTKFLWVITKEDILKKVEVQTGIKSDFEVEIIEGVELGDKVVLNPTANLREGIKVNVNQRK